MIEKLRPHPLDAALAAGLLVWQLAEGGGDPLPTTAGAVLMSAPLALRRTYPLAVMAAVALGFVVGALQPDPPETLAGLVSLLVAPYSAAAYAHRRAAAIAALAVALAAGVVEPLLVGDGDFLFIEVLTGAAWAAGWIVHGRQRESAELESRAAQLAAESEQRTREAVAEERRRLARELHDVVAHGVSVMTVQAGAAEQVLASDPDYAAEALRSIQRSGREAMADLQRMLSLLRESGDAAEHAPAGALDRLEPLLDSFREAGVPLELTVSGERTTLPAGIELSAYRVVQESLTNALKHARGARCEVLVHYSPAELEVRVRSAAATNGAGPELAGAGRGLAGLRERVALYGGEFRAGPGDGGFEVRASLPLPREAP